jgi:hypothetical protein
MSDLIDPRLSTAYQQIQEALLKRRPEFQSYQVQEQQLPRLIPSLRADPAPSFLPYEKLLKELSYEQPLPYPLDWLGSDHEMAAIERNADRRHGLRAEQKRMRSK